MLRNNLLYVTVEHQKAYLLPVNDLISLSVNTCETHEHINKNAYYTVIKGIEYDIKMSC